MQVWAVIAQKGGAGKTTISIHTSIAAAATGLNIQVIDVDPQQSAWRWGQVRKRPQPQFSNCVVPDLPTLLERAKRAKVDICIIDTSPRADRDSLTVAKLCSMVIVPVRPTILDLPAVKDTLELLKGVGAFDRTVAVLNAVAPKTNEGEQGAAYLDELGVTLCPTRVGDRADLRASLIERKGVTEADPRSQAAKEIVALTKWLLKMGEKYKMPRQLKEVAND